jgi:hypothetical protein
MIDKGYSQEIHEISDQIRENLSSCKDKGYECGIYFQMV